MLLYLSRALILLFTGLFLPSMAQVQPDTLKSAQKKSSGNRKESNGITDSAAYHNQAMQISRSRDFYGRLEKRSDTSYFLKNLYPLLFRKPSLTFHPTFRSPVTRAKLSATFESANFLSSDHQYMTVCRAMKPAYSGC